jgi:competence protein ComEA
MKWRWLYKELIQSKKWKATLIAFVLLVAFFVTIFNPTQDAITVIEVENPGKNHPDLIQEEAEAEINDSLATILVDVGGAVMQPGVVELEEGSRVFQALSKVGGPSPDADLTPINQAMILTDGVKIIIPTLEETKQGSTEYNFSSEYIVNSNGTTASGKVNINTASPEELQTLSGVGPVTASKIVDYRNKNGSFKTLDNLMDVPGIGEKTFDSLKDFICL